MSSNFPITLVKTSVLALLFLLQCPSLPAQGLVDGFMKGRGQTDAVLSYSFESYSQYYAGTTAVENPGLGTIRTQSASLFVAAGISSWLDVIVNVPQVWTAPSQGFWPSQSGLQDFSGALRLLAFERSFGSVGFVRLMLAGGLRLPLTAYVPDAPVAIGHQSTQLDSRAILHYQHPSGVFAMAQGGYLRQGNVVIDRGYEVLVPDAFEGLFRVGYAGSKIYGHGWLHLREARSGTDLGPGVPFPTNKIDFVRAGIDVAAPIPGMERFSGVVGTGFTLRGRNVGQATRFSAGLIYHLPSWKGL